MKITYQRERVADLHRDGVPLFQQHAAEQEHDHTLPLDLDVARYQLAEEIGILRIYTVRADTTLIGYAVFTVGFSMRHQTILQAVQDSLYLEPGSRRGSTGVRFLRYVEAELRADGVTTMHQHTHPGTTLDRMLPKMGYALVHHEWERRLDR